MPPNNKARSSLYKQLRTTIIGRPIASQRSDSELIPVLLAMPILCTDAISSVAYATQQILLALGAAGLWTLDQQVIYGQYTIGLSAAIVLLLVIVVASYSQTVFAYPNGGGSYAVAKENLGRTPSLIAAAALLIDYVLTVAVSVASGVQNLEDIPALSSFHIREHLVFYCLLFTVLLIIANLRGLKEAGTLFAIPTYLFVAMCYVMIAVGLIGPSFNWQYHTEFVTQQWPHVEGTAQALGLFGVALVLRAFANGCSAMTGTEAVSNGVPVFKEPKSRNAAITLILMGLMLGTTFMGMSWLAVKMHVVYWELNGQTSPAVIDQIAGATFGKSGLMSIAYMLTQFSTAFILIIAANTSFAGFPRLASILAQDGFLPRQLASLGDRLVFNNGIILLGAFSMFFLVLKRGNVDALIPLFMIGVFVSFTMSQAGMVKHWFRNKGPGWQRKSVINGIGAVATLVVFIDIAYEKFVSGAWIVMLFIGVLLFLFTKLRAHYNWIVERLALKNYHPQSTQGNTVIVLVQSLNVATMYALDYARSLTKDCIALHIDVVPEQTASLRELWPQHVPDVKLVSLTSPYRSLITPVIKYLSVMPAERPNSRVTVIIGEFVSDKWWHPFLHGNAGLILKLALLNRPEIVVANLRYSLKEERKGGEEKDAQNTDGQS